MRYNRKFVSSSSVERRRDCFDLRNGMATSNYVGRTTVVATDVERQRMKVVDLRFRRKLPAEDTGS